MAGPSPVTTPPPVNRPLPPGGTTQGWTQPKNSKLRHYILRGESLCKRWYIEGLFKRSVNALGFDLQPGVKKCADCVRRLQQLINIGRLPALPPVLDEHLEINPLILRG